MINPFKLLSKVTGQNKVFTLYHAVADDVPLHLKHLYKIKTLKEFEEDLLFYKKYFNYLKINEFSGSVKSSKPLIFITFDDGLRAFKINAFPLLKKHGFTPILFVNSGFVNNQDMLFRFKASLLIEQVLNIKKIDYQEITNVTGRDIQQKDHLIEYLKSAKYSDTSVLNRLSKPLGVDFQSYLEKEQPYLSLEELKDLQDEGVIIGAHSIDHPLFKELPLEKQLEQVEHSVRWVEEHLQPKIRTFAFPFTDFGVPKELFEQMYEGGINLDYSFGCAGLKREKYPKHLHRVPVEYPSAKTILWHQYWYFLLKAPFFKNTIKR